MKNSDVHKETTVRPYEKGKTWNEDVSEIEEIRRGKARNKAVRRRN
jgi:hypothetical protein